MLPIYISYFAGRGDKKTSRTLINALCFVLGFTLVFLAMGALAGSFGQFLTKYSVAVNIVTRVKSLCTKYVPALTTIQ